MKRAWNRGNFSPFLLFSFSPFLLTGCTQQTTLPNAQRPTPNAQSAASSIKFEEVAEAAGVRYHWTIPGKRPLNILQTIGNGCAFLDYDNDGNLDILLVGTKPALFQGGGKGKFADVTQAVGLNKLTGHFLGCAVGDYDNDGNDDIYLTAYRGGALLHNERGKTFRDVTKAVGLPAQPWNTSAAFVDINNDGKLDLFLGNYAIFGADTKPQMCEFTKVSGGSVMGSCGPRNYDPEKNKLYLNTGSRFQDVTTAWGANATSGKALGVACADYNNSGKQSIAIANDEMPGDLLQNQGGEFHNVASDAGTSHDSDGGVHGGMGTDWGDYDNDGQLDLAVATFQQEPKNIYRGDSGVFSDQSTRLGLTEKTLRLIAFGIKWFDADNDGWLDLMIANGHVQDNIAEVDPTLSYRQPTQLFRNVDGKRLEDIGASANAALSVPIVGRGLAVGDYDNDGKMDALVVDSEGKPLLLHNLSTTASHWLTLKLVGTKTNRNGYGARVTVKVGERTLLRHCASDGSYMSASDNRVHFGLGAHSAPVTVTVQWAGGKSQTYADVPIDKITMLTEKNN